MAKETKKESTAPGVTFPQASTYDEMERIIEVYKERNPQKYEAKKDELAKKLAALKK
jgi:hypothetical protein